MAKTLSYINTTPRTGSGQDSTSGSAQSSRPSFIGASAGVTMSEVVNRFLPVIAENYADAVTQLMSGNYLYNPAFANGAEGWVISDAEKAYIAVSDDKNRLFLTSGGSVLQLNEKIRKPGKHKEYKFTEDRPEKNIPQESYTPSSTLVTNAVQWGNIEDPVKKNGKQEKNNNLYLNLSFVCSKSGTIHFGFVGSGSSDKDALKHQDIQIQESIEVQTFSAQGTWDGKGNFRIYLSEGEVEIVSLSLTDSPIEDLRKETETRLAQAEENIQVILETTQALLQRIRLVQSHINQLYSNDGLLKDVNDSQSRSITTLRDDLKNLQDRVTALEKAAK